MPFVSFPLNGFFTTKDSLLEEIQTETLQNMFKLSEADLSSVEYFALSRIENLSEVHEEEHIIAMVNTMKMGISDLLEWEFERQRLEELLDRTKEAYSFISSKSFPEGGTGSGGNSGSPSTQKLKSLEDENGRLKTLLKHQIEASEKLRVETQMTIETLKEEFDILVKELSQFQKKEMINSAVAQSIQKKITGIKNQNYQHISNAASQLKNMG